MRFPGNCLVVALIACLGDNTLRVKRNRLGRIHFFWTDRHGRAFEFYTKGASGRTYLKNSLCMGEIKRCLP